jgi:RNA ligase (TIGR02306 family)
MREATIQVIKEVLPVENADTLELAKVLGWQVIVKKGNFVIGDLAIFIEIDSLLPDKPEFEFMRSRKFRVKTAKIRGVLSQGIAFPMSILPPGDYKEDDDVTELLGVVHYEKPVPSGGSFKSGINRGNFPPFIPKTDEPRLQSNPETLQEFKGLKCYITTKCDGTSSTFALRDDKFYVCSRNWDKQESIENIYWQMAKKYDLERIIRSVGSDLAIQAEIVGPGIQKNRLGLKELEIRIFDVWNIDSQRYFSFEDLNTFCRFYSLPMVPVEELVEEFGFTKYLGMNELILRAEGYYEGTKNRKEGIVIRSVEPRFSEALRRRLSVKVLNNFFLLKDEE